MKIGCWIFMFMGVMGILCLLIGAFGIPADMSLYGYSTNKPISFMGIFLAIVIGIKGFAAYSLWFEKSNAISIGKFDAILGFVLCVIALVYFPLVHHTISIRLEILFLIPYYKVLNRMEYAWENLEEQ
ncbi:hypothetical protein [Flavobacterium sp.]|uniref:hypothetical protein n=1 Tax=Flavobacterium sp. TaxID=239 RepID=UPI0039E62255